MQSFPGKPLDENPKLRARQGGSSVPSPLLRVYWRVTLRMHASEASPTTRLHSKQPRFRTNADAPRGLAQLSLLETALCPLDVKISVGGFVHEAKYFFTPRSDDAAGKRKAANVRVSAPLGLLPNDEYNLWGLLALTFASHEPQPRLMATPHWCLRQLGVLRPDRSKGGSQYVTFRESLNRLAHVTYHCDGFYNPIKNAHEFATFGFLDILLPSDPESSRAWELRWNSVFFEFCRATGGKLLFDLDLFRQLDYASRRLFLKLKDRFWRKQTAQFDLGHLAIDGLGFSPAIRPCDLKVKLSRSIRKLLEYRIIRLPEGAASPKQLFTKRAKGCYAVTFHRGSYFDLPAGTTPALLQQTGIADSPLYDPLKAIGFEDSAVRRIIRQYPARTVQRWAEITLIAMEKTPRGFPGFKTSPQAFCMHGIQNAHMPPDWYYAEKKREERRDWQQYRAAASEREVEDAAAYHTERAKAFKRHIDEEIGRDAYEQTVRMFQEFHAASLHPEAAREAALRDANRHYEAGFRFPEPHDWDMHGTGTRLSEPSGD